MATSRSIEGESDRRTESVEATTGTSQQERPHRPQVPRPDRQPSRRQRRGRLAAVVAGSLGFGLLAALFLAGMPFIAAERSELAGAVLSGFAIGWVMLALLSARLTDQPQQWAWAPAVFMGLGGLTLIAFGAGADDLLRWVWPLAVLALSVWMVARIRRDMGSRFGRWLLYPAVALLAVVSVAGGTETVRSATSAKPAMPGQLIDVGGHRLHLHCTGSGNPTVVLEPGAGMSSSTTGWVVPAVAPVSRVCVYDRAGRGWSDPADTPQDATRIATDLHTLLQRANVPGPYVLAGHSFGGLYALTYAAQYPGDVAGMVLVDSTAPVSAPTSPASRAGAYDLTARISALVSSTARFGLMRLIISLEGATLPPQSEAAERASLVSSEHLRSTVEEYLQGGTSAEEAAKLTTLKDKPLFVLSAGVGSSPDWMPKQDKLAALSTNSVHRVVESAAHADFLVDERAARTTSQAILDVVASVRGGEPLGSE
jgi:pimeloyl-ACP methyl ester carboxylesterase